MLYYIKKAIRYPHLIKEFFYKDHTGVIFSYDISKYKDVDYKYNDLLIYKESSDYEGISNFYIQNGRDRFTPNKVENYILNGHKCWVVIYNKRIIGALWLFRDKVEITSLSARTLSSNNCIKFHDNTLYCAYVIIEENYRKKGLFKEFINFIIKHYKYNNNIDKILLITGATNGAMINICMNSSAKLIGIVNVKRILGFTKRKEMYIDYREKIWD